jgi:hypothetical protein
MNSSKSRPALTGPRGVSSSLSLQKPRGPDPIRVVARCGRCGREYREIPKDARRCLLGDLTVHDWDCPCLPAGAGNGIEAVTRGGIALTQAELAFELARKGIKP